MQVSLNKYKTWVWAKQMSFLKPFLTMAKTQLNVLSQHLLAKEDNNLSAESGS